MSSFFDGRVYFHEEVTSTSDIASKLAKQGQKIPFAVCAQTQTCGRGRQQRSWQSPAGNLYLTLALPLPPSLSPPLVPLAAASLVASWMSKKFGLGVSIKWPNDLLFGNKKIAGILCEASVQGSQVDYVLVGIGVNLREAPSLTDLPGGYGATALAEHVQVEGSYQDLAKSLLEEWGRTWSSLDLEYVFKIYRRYALSEGEFWLNRQNSDVFCQMNFADDGGLRLRSLNGGRPISVQSSEHDFQLARQLKATRALPRLVVDQGNTRTKFWIFPIGPEGISQKAVESSPVNPNFSFLNSELSVERCLSVLEYLKEEFNLSVLNWPAHIASVNPTAFESLRSCCEQSGLIPIAIEKRRRRSIELCYPLAQLGIDRLALVEGYLAGLTLDARNDPGRIGVLVSVGSATTIDVVRSRGMHLGGVIFPGPMMAAAALHESTGLLPLVATNKISCRESCGQAGTESALGAGIGQMVAGAVERLMRLVQKETGATNIDLIFCGGDGEDFALELGGEYRKDLLARGLEALI